MGTILRYLWHMYGFDFSNAAGPLLRSSAMAFAVVQHATMSDPTRLSSDYYEYLSDVYIRLHQVVKANCVEESDIFAL